MLEGQEDEVAQVRPEREVVAALDRPVREHQGQRVCGELVRRAAETVARELVQQDQQGERPLGRIGPVIQLSPRRHHVAVLEPLPEGRVEDVVLGEPQLRACVFPEADDVGRL